jgi:LacI family transcriptional regulator
LPYAENNRPGIERARSFREALDGAIGGGVTGIAVSGSQYTDSATQETLRQLDGATPPDAILVGHNQMLPRVLSSLRERGLKVGQDISIISCDRTDVAEFYDPPIAGITRDLVKIGDIAFDLFRYLADGQGAPVCRAVCTSYEPTTSVFQRL